MLGEVVELVSASGAPLQPCALDRPGPHVLIKTMTISLTFDDEQSIRLEQCARELGVDPRELAKAAVNDLLTQPSQDFDRVACFVLEKNQDLYRRLSE